MLLKKIGCLALSMTFVIAMLGVQAKADKLELSNNDITEISLETSKKVDSKKVVLASKDKFADSLSAVNIAISYRAKLILINNETDIEKVIPAGTEEVAIVGGPATISDNIKDRVTNIVKDTYRIGGRDRYATNEKTLNEIGATEVGVADGRNFADALSASGLAASEKLGIMLVDGSKPYSTNRTVKYTFGGVNSVLQEGGVRLAGPDRYETSAVINSRIKGPKAVVVAPGNRFQEAMLAVNIINAYGNTNVLLSDRGLTKSEMKIFESVSNQIVINAIAKEKEIDKRISQATANSNNAKDKNYEYFTITKDPKINKLVRLKFSKGLMNNIIVKPIDPMFDGGDSGYYEGGAKISTKKKFDGINRDILYIGVKRHYHPYERDNKYSMLLGKLNAYGKVYEIYAIGDSYRDFFANESWGRAFFPTLKRVQNELSNGGVEGLSGAVFTLNPAYVR